LTVRHKEIGKIVRYEKKEKVNWRKVSHKGHKWNEVAEVKANIFQVHNLHL
jgi:hypothetical protein